MIVKTNELAYFLGYIAWGNHLYLNEQKEYTSYIISATPEKQKALKYFKTLFDLTTEVKHYPGYNRVVLRIPIDPIYRLLDSFYYGGKKLLKFDFPPKISKDLFGSYLRGYFEKHGTADFQISSTSTRRKVIMTMPSDKFGKSLVKRLRIEGISATTFTCNQTYNKKAFRTIVTIKTESYEDFFDLIYGLKFGPSLPIKGRLEELAEYVR